MEQYVFDKMDKRNREILTNEEDLGQHMIDAGTDFGSGTAYGTYPTNLNQKIEKNLQKEGNLGHRL